MDLLLVDDGTENRTKINLGFFWDFYQRHTLPGPRICAISFGYVFLTVLFENCFQKHVFKPLAELILIEILETNLVHMPQGSVPESFVSPSCPKFHAHLIIKITQFDLATKSPKDYSFLNFQSTKFPKKDKENLQQHQQIEQMYQTFQT